MSDEASGIESVVSDYVVGMARGNRDLLLQVFHPKAVSVGHFDGVLEWASVTEFAEACEAEKVLETEPVPAWDIEEVRVSGDTAVVICTNVWAGYRFRDTLTMLKSDGQWSIVFKLFHHLG